MIHNFISKRSATADDTDISLLKDLSRKNPYHTFSGRNEPRTVGTNQQCASLFCKAMRLDDIQGRNAFCNTDYQQDACVCSFHDSIRCKTCWDKNNRSIRLCLFYGFIHRIENRNTVYIHASFTRRSSTNDIRSVFFHLFSMKKPVSTGDTLYDQTSGFIY